MLKKILIGLLALVVVGGGVAWMNRKPLVLFLVTNAGKRTDIGPNIPVPWKDGPAEASTPLTARQPNIVFILADDLGFNDISTFGGGVAGGKVPTPNIDRLAARGAIFSQAYAGTATCAPSRAMIMTGRYPTRTGFEFTPTPDGMGGIVKMFTDTKATGLPPLKFNKKQADKSPPFALQGLPGSEVTMAEVLRDAGYHTVHIGKWHTGLGPEFGPNAQGFDESLLMASALYLPEDSPNVVNAKLPFDPIDTFLWARMQYAAAYNEGKWFQPGGYLTDYWTDEAIKVIHNNRNRPFFLNVAHWGVHTPLQATKADYDAVGDIQPERLRVYAAMVRALDRSVGRILDALDEEGLTDNTMIVFTSDNGGAGYIGLSDINRPYRGWKMTLFEGGIHVPMFISWPGHIAADQTVTAPVAHIDLMPTFAAAAGSSTPPGVEIDGVNLLPFATGTAAPDQKPHDVIFWQSAYYKAVRQGDWKLQVTEHPAKTWLFNLADDPDEKKNVADQNPEEVAALKQLLADHQATARPPLYPYTTEGPVAIDKTAADKATPDDEYVYWPN
jgi:arylsulfatase A-like enzyme